jgi:bacteriorhodopsin
MLLRNANKHFWRRYRGWILSPYLVIALKMATSISGTVAGEGISENILVGHVRDNMIM